VQVRAVFAGVSLFACVLSGCTGDPVLPPPTLVRYDACNALLDRLKTEALAVVDAMGIREPVTIAASPIPVFTDEGGSRGDIGRPAFGPPPPVPVPARVTVNPSAGRTNPSVSVANLGSSPRRAVLTYTRSSDRGNRTKVHVRLPKADGYRVLATQRHAFAIGGQHDRIPASAPSFGNGITTVIAIVDLTSPTPRLTSTVRLEGSPATASLVDDRLRLVLESDGTRLHLDGASTKDDPKKVAAFNRRRVASSNIDRWLPHYAVETSDEVTRTGTIVPCDRALVPEAGAVTGALSVVTLDAVDPQPVAATSILGSRTGINVTSDALFVARSTLPTGAEPSDRPEHGDTSIFVLSLANDGSTLRMTSGHVDGVLLDGWGGRLNQWSIVPSANGLNVVTRRHNGRATRTDVHLLRPGSDRMTTVSAYTHTGDRIAGLKIFERVAALVEWEAGRRGSTRLLDLSDTRRPRLAGALPVPSYWTFIDAPTRTTLLTVTGRGDEKGSRTLVRLYDVADPDRPHLVDEVDTKQVAHGLAIFDPTTSILDVSLRGPDGHYHVDPVRGFSVIADSGRPAVKPTMGFDVYWPL
jgi:hypothetical protein